MSDQVSVGTTTSYFTRKVARKESEVLAKQVVVPKDKRGTHGSREFGIHYLKATGALDQVFGAAVIFCQQVRKEKPTNHIIKFNKCKLETYRS